MTPEQLKEAAKGLFAQVKSYVERSTAPLRDRLDGLDQRIASMPVAEKGERGEPGRDGLAGERGERGEAGEKGERGEPGERGERGERGEKGDPGRDAKDGAPGEPGERGMPGAKGEPGADGRDGRDGEPGRDALHVEVLDGIDAAKRYQRGTFATHRGGLVRAFRATDPIAGAEDLERAGWHAVVRGIADVGFLVSDDGRDWTLQLTYTDGQKAQHAVSVPALIYRGIWREDGVYTKGDATTRDGSVWVLDGDATGKPGEEGSGWRLAVKKGRDGRDGLKGEKGERGAEGRAGKDLTQLGFDGRKS